MKSTLISFIGSNDAGKKEKTQITDGAILTVLKERKFDEIHLLWNPTIDNEKNYYKIGLYVKSEIIKRKLYKEEEIFLHSFECNNVTDHNEIYPKLLVFCKSLPTKRKYTAAIASGTPSMQVCWILMAESGDFDIELIRSNEKKYGYPLITEVKIGTGLPRIIRYEDEKNRLIKINKKQFPKILYRTKDGLIRINNKLIDFSPIESVYYRYFLNRILKNQEFLRISNISLPNDFLDSIINYFIESYPDAIDTLDYLIKLQKSKIGVSSNTFRSNISRLNKKLRQLNIPEDIIYFYEISSEGKRFSKSYGISLQKEKIQII